VNALDPERIYLSGEIIGAWDLIEPTVRRAQAERALAPAGGATELVTMRSRNTPRLKGAAALVSSDVLVSQVA